MADTNPIHLFARDHACAISVPHRNLFHLKEPARHTMSFVLLFLLVSTPALLCGAQTMPAGQITRQIVAKAAPSPAIKQMKLETFKESLSRNLGNTTLTSEQVDKVMDATDLSTNLSDAFSLATKAAPADSADTRKLATDAVKKAAASAESAAAAAQTDTAAPVTKCVADADGNYSFYFALPTMRGCTPDGITNFFKVAGDISIASTVQYLYNPNQSTSQIGADLFTATFPLGFQAILSGTATAGSSQAAGSTTTSSSAGVSAYASTPAATSTQTDSVDTAVAKLEQGGDFNVRFPVPLLYHVTDKYGFYTLTSPAVGFNVSGLTSQNTITESDEYNVNLPLEMYFQTGSIEKMTDSSTTSKALLYVDIRPAMELVSPQFAKAIGLTSSRFFLLGQANAGIEFGGSVRVGFQYFYGPSQVYSVASSSGGSTTTTAKMGGLHLVVSFSPRSGS